MKDITVEELRTGNLLNYDTAEGDVLPSPMDWQDLKWITEDPKGFNLVHSPIPLNEDWLLRFGLHLEGTEKWRSGINDISRTVKTYSYEYYDPEIRVTVVYDYEEKELRRTGIDECQGRKTMDIKYVHEFQNVFFVLTGTELTTTPTNR